MSEALKALEGEVVDDGDTLEDGSVVVTLTTEAGQADMHVKAVQKWKASGVRGMRQGDFDTWAEKALSAESYKQWVRLDPDLDEVEVFFESWNEVTGQSPKGSAARTRFSKSTAPR